MRVSRERRFRRVAAMTAAATGLATVATVTAPLAASAGTPADGASVDARIASLLQTMTLPEKVGQLFVTYVYGDSATTTNPAYTSVNQQLYGVDNGAELIAKYHPGGVIYFSWSGNLANPTQIAGLSDGLQRAALAQPSGIPLQISTDQEGGIVNRIGAPAAVSPGNMALGATFRPESARAAMSVTATQLRAMGINTDDAPVVDVNTDPRNAADGPRAFGDRPDDVARFAREAVIGLQQRGVAATAKHFPGLGDTTVNTDDGVAVTNETRDQILSTDVPPFRAAMDAGVDSVMAAHIVAPALDPSGTPASLSEPIVTGLLRDELGYDGVVVTDSLEAAALAAVPADERSLDALLAGDDELLMPPSLPGAEQAILDAVASGTVSESRIDQSVTRILRLKYRLGLFDDPFSEASSTGSTDGTAPTTLPDVGTTQQQRVMDTLAQRSITMLRNENGTLPIAAGSGEHVLVTGWGSSSTSIVTSDLNAAGLVATRYYTGSNPSTTTIQRVVAAAGANDVTVVLTNNAWGDTGQQRLVQALTDAGRRVVAVSVGGPYDIAYFPDVPAYLAAYDYQPVSLHAIVRTLLGASPTGRLPVTIAAADGSGATLYPYGAGIGYPDDSTS